MSEDQKICFDLANGEDDRRLLLGMIESALGLYKRTLKSDINERMEQQFKSQVKSCNALYAQIANNPGTRIKLKLENGEADRWQIMNAITLALQQYEEVASALPVGTTRDIFQRKIARGNELYVLIEDADAPC